MNCERELNKIEFGRINPFVVLRLQGYKISMKKNKIQKK